MLDIALDLVEIASRLDKMEATFFLSRVGHLDHPIFFDLK